MEERHNPADEPGAIVFTPEVDPMMRYDREKDIVVDTRNGDYMAYQVNSMQEQIFTFRIVNASETSSIYFPAQRLGHYESGGKISPQYEIRFSRTGLGADRRFFYSDELDLERLARFINANQNLSPTGNAVVIDNREKNRTGQ